MENTVHFFDLLAERTHQKSTPLVVGIDPRAKNLPAQLAGDLDSNDYAATADLFTKFSCEIIDTVSPLVAAIKPQAAFFEQLGPPGMVALGKVIDHAKSNGLLVVLDGKRNDIGSTAQAYAEAYLGAGSGWNCDALTINPYMGDDSLQPFIDRAVKSCSGLFALVKTSNPGSKTFQDLSSNDQPIYQHVANWIQNAAQQTAGERGYGVIGAVVGATHPQQLAQLRTAMPNTYFLIPGFGAQGGKASDIATAFDSKGGGAIVNSSRGIIFAYENEQFAGQSSWQKSVEAATLHAIAVLRDNIPA